MGYISSVGLCLLENDYNELVELAKPLTESYSKNALLNNVQPKHFESDGYKYIYLYWPAIKWYHEFDEVKLIEEFIPDHPHSFIRIGEYFDDIEFDVKDDYYEHDFLYFVQTVKREICSLEVPNGMVS